MCAPHYPLYPGSTSSLQTMFYLSYRSRIRNIYLRTQKLHPAPSCLLIQSSLPLKGAEPLLVFCHLLAALRFPKIHSSPLPGKKTDRGNPSNCHNNLFRDSTVSRGYPQRSPPLHLDHPLSVHLLVQSICTQFCTIHQDWPGLAR